METRSNGAPRGLCAQRFVFGVFVILCFCDVSSAFSELEDSDEEGFQHPRFQHTLELATDEIRCNCNEPECVTTGYMCKSVGGGCFSELIDRHRAADVYNNRHGCLQRNQRDTCKNSQNVKLTCCFKDMCNQIGRDRPLFNASYVPEFLNTDGPNELMEHNMSPTAPGYNSNEVWFKAAIIAVPICGIVILILLIFLAVKILRTDSLNSSGKLGNPYTHGSDRKSNRDHFDHIQHQSSHNLKKVPLLIHHHHHHNHNEVVTNHSSEEPQKPPSLPLLVQNPTGISYDKKNEANAKLNSAQNEFLCKENNSPLLGLQKQLNSSNNVYRNVNLSVSPAPAAVDTSTSEKLYDKQALNAVISWGAPSHSSSPV